MHVKCVCPILALTTVVAAIAVGNEWDAPVGLKPCANHAYLRNYAMVTVAVEWFVLCADLAGLWVRIGKCVPNVACLTTAATGTVLLVNTCFGSAQNLALFWFAIMATAVWYLMPLVLAFSPTPVLWDVSAPGHARAPHRHIPSVLRSGAYNTV